MFLATLLQYFTNGSSKDKFVTTVPGKYLTCRLQPFPIAYGNTFLVSSWNQLFCSGNSFWIFLFCCTMYVPYMLWRSWTLLPVLLARKLKRSFAPSYLRVKAKACRLVDDLVLLWRMYSATTVNVRRLVLTPARYTSVCFDESERLSSPDIRVALFFALLAFMQAMVLGEPKSLRSGWFSLCNTSLSDFQMYL